MHPAALSHAPPSWQTLGLILPSPRAGVSPCFVSPGAGGESQGTAEVRRVTVAAGTRHKEGRGLWLQLSREGPRQRACWRPSRAVFMLVGIKRREKRPGRDDQEPGAARRVGRPAPPPLSFVQGSPALGGHPFVCTPPGDPQTSAERIPTTPSPVLNDWTGPQGFIAFSDSNMPDLKTMNPLQSLWPHSACQLLNPRNLSSHLWVM